MSRWKGEGEGKIKSAIECRIRKGGVSTVKNANRILASVARRRISI